VNATISMAADATHDGDPRPGPLVATEALRRFGMRGRHVASGEEALALLQRERFDLVLMDCQMPGLDGFETTMRWRDREAARGDGAHVPIIAVTANAASGDRERCLAAGMDDYLAKPFELRALRSLIEHHLTHRGHGASRADGGA
jgi:CheY-like chemotaxis protein